MNHKNTTEALRVQANKLQEAATHLYAAVSALEDAANLDLGDARVEAGPHGASVTLVRRRASMGSRAKPGPKPKAKAGKRRLSEAGRLAISRAAKKRWAALRRKKAAAGK